MASPNSGNNEGRLGEMLIRDKLISPLQLQKAVDEQRADGNRLGYQLTKMGFIEENELTAFLSKQYGLPSINLNEFEVSAEVIKMIPKEVALKHQVIPVNRSGNTLIIAMADPSNYFAIDDIKFLTGFNVEVVVAAESAIMENIEKYYSNSVNFDDVMMDFQDEDVDFESSGEQLDDIMDVEKSAGEAPVIKLVNLILVDAIKRGASDIHIEPYEKSMRVRYRIDGMLYEVMKPPMKLKNAITSRIKIMSNLDIAERRLPQDGRIKLKMGRGKEMDFRVSVCPVIWGEKVVMRLLDKGNLQLDMTKLGFDAKILAEFKESINKPYGMILITGPTGSGKTTTLYSALSELNKIDTNISTAEDPVEYNLMGINQVQMQDSIGLNFAAALRSFLRQDPDIIMVGEIRDFETAEIGIKAALTGHLVLSTLHTNDTPGTITRLLNMGVEPFLVASAINLIQAQRLARRICKDCKEVTEARPDALIKLGFPEEEVDQITIYRGMGCKTCNNTGYKGRVGLYEVLTMREEIKELVLNGASTLDIKREAVRLGMVTLRAAALGKLREGMTTIDEVVRVTISD